MAPLFHAVTSGPTRKLDAWGSGQYGARRDGGSRPHAGLDLVAMPGEVVFSPIEGDIWRESFPYKDDLSLRGISILGSGQWRGYEIKLFYVDAFFSGHVQPGQMIGRAQDIRWKYPTITNHVHLEVRIDGVVQSPMNSFGMCF